MAGDAKKLQPIIIKRVKKGGHAVHGGAWKIAYADFVTAMMAFFLLMMMGCSFLASPAISPPPESASGPAEPVPRRQLHAGAGRHFLPFTWDSSSVNDGRSPE